jgi:hypothetical protein
MVSDSIYEYIMLIIKYCQNGFLFFFYMKWWNSTKSRIIQYSGYRNIGY